MSNSIKFFDSKRIENLTLCYGVLATKKAKNADGSVSQILDRSAFINDSGIHVAESLLVKHVSIVSDYTEKGDPIFNLDWDNSTDHMLRSKRFDSKSLKCLATNTRKVRVRKESDKGYKHEVYNGTITRKHDKDINAVNPLFVTFYLENWQADMIEKQKQEDDFVFASNVHTLNSMDKMISESAVNFE